ncbi:MAG TPA: hypothetical protein PKJ37_12550 [Acidobacteriota bacterium]|jgi:hypothetical protein|nr:hypothetical protein [Acidobacteriota bacterium]
MTTVETVIGNLRAQANEAMDYSKKALEDYWTSPTDDQMQKTKLALQNAAQRIEEYQLKIRMLNEAAMQEVAMPQERRV